MTDKGEQYRIKHFTYKVATGYAFGGDTFSRADAVTMVNEANASAEYLGIHFKIEPAKKEIGSDGRRS